MSTKTLESFLNEQRALVEVREIDAAVAYWEAGMAATPEAEEHAARCQAELDACYADPHRFAQLLAIAEPDERDLRRQRRIVADDFARKQMPQNVIEDIAKREMEIESLFANYRAALDGRHVSDNDLRAILRSSDNAAEREEAWRAGKQIGAQVCGKLLDLVAIRNREARRCGYDNYYSMSMELQEIDQTELFRTLEQVSAAVEPAFEDAKLLFDEQLAEHFRLDPRQLRPWHYSDPFFQEAPSDNDGRLDKLFEGRKLEDILVAFYDAIDLDIHPLLNRADLYEKPGKNQHAYCLSVGRGTGDVRVNCNLRSDAKWMGTLLHEFGHAVYDNEIDPSLPFFLKAVSHIMTTEAIAETMGRFVTNAAWLRRWVGGPTAELDGIGAAVGEMQRRHLLVFTQWVQVIAHFERELYRDPEQDLDGLWWDLVVRYQHLTKPDDAPRHAWAAKIHLSTSPVYYHNYLMGEMISSQLLHYLRTHIVANDDELVDSPKVGRWLKERFFRPGARYTWNELVAHATGEPLSPRYFVDELCAGRNAAQ